MRFPLLESEELIQEDDKIRLSAAKSFVSGDTALTDVLIKPSKSDSYLSVFNADQSRWYLDWAYPFEIDVDSTNNKLDFQEAGGPLVATIPDGSYSMSELAVEIQSQLVAAGALAYTVSVVGDVFTIAAPSNFSLLAASGANLATSLYAEIGFVADKTASNSYASAKVKTVNKQVSVRVTNIAGSTDVTKTIQVISESADHLFSNDGQLKQHEFDVMNYLPAGKASHIYAHRRSQTEILAWLDKEGYVDPYGNKYTKDAIVDVSEVSEWSLFLTLRLIFQSVSNDIEDVFAKKAEMYGKLESVWRDRAVLRLDIDGDGDSDTGEEIQIKGAFCARR